jgi:PadR family transcriptional regulator PadR
LSVTRFLQPCLLLLLHQNPSHGYNLIDGLVSNGYAEEPVDSGAIYRYLREMERDGLVVSEWDTGATAGPARRIYRITTEGDRVLALWMSDLRQTDKILRRLLAAYDRHMEEGEGQHHPE